jgi:cytochrome c peroxidase
MKYTKPFVFLVLMSTIVTLNNCKRDDPDEPDEPIVEIDTVDYDGTLYNLEYGTFTKPDFNNNELTIQGVKLGRMLFYETQLSADNSISCASCHKQENAFTDPDRFSEGVGGSLGLRQAMSVFNTAWHTNEFFWDGRAHLLRDQSLKPIEDELEMKETLENVIEKLNAEQDYLDQFERAFGDDNITSERMSLAMEQFMNSIVSNRSKYDNYLAGTANLTASEERGRELFFAEYNPSFPNESGADCAHCHGGNNFDNNRYMNNGLDLEGDQDDIGREDVTGDPNDKAKFKVASLRNIEVTAPYMHDGRFNTLEEVVNHYNDGIKVSPTVDQALEYTTQTGLMLSEQDKQDLIAFLKTLTDEELLTDKRYSDPFN